MLWYLMVYSTVARLSVAVGNGPLGSIRENTLGRVSVKGNYRLWGDIGISHTTQVDWPPSAAIHHPLLSGNSQNAPQSISPMPFCPAIRPFDCHSHPYPPLPIRLHGSCPRNKWHHPSTTQWPFHWPLQQIESLHIKCHVACMYSM